MKNRKKMFDCFAKLEKIDYSNMSDVIKSENSEIKLPNINTIYPIKPPRTIVHNASFDFALRINIFSTQFNKTHTLNTRERGCLYKGVNSPFEKILLVDRNFLSDTDLSFEYLFALSSVYLAF